MSMASPHIHGVVGLDPDGADAIVPRELASMVVRRHAHRLRWPIR
jgi:hypothetical protein